MFRTTGPPSGSRSKLKLRKKEEPRLTSKNRTPKWLITNHSKRKGLNNIQLLNKTKSQPKNQHKPTSLRRMLLKVAQPKRPAQIARLLNQVTHQKAPASSQNNLNLNNLTNNNKSLRFRQQIIIINNRPTLKIIIKDKKQINRQSHKMAQSKATKPSKTEKKKL